MLFRSEHLDDLCIAKARERMYEISLTGNTKAKAASSITFNTFFLLQLKQYCKEVSVTRDQVAVCGVGAGAAMSHIHICMHTSRSCFCVCLLVLLCIVIAFISLYKL